MSACALCAALALAALPRAASASSVTAESPAPEVLVRGVVFYYQTHNLDCEEAAVSMALTHEGIVLDQEDILRAIGADKAPARVDPNGRMRWGDPYTTFVGSVDGYEFKDTGYGAAYPPLIRVARAHGANVLRAGPMTVDSVYTYLWSAHPVVVWATWDWKFHDRNDYLAFDGRWIPWIGPYDAHVYTVVGIRPGAVLVDDPLRGRYWVAMDAFAAAYSDFMEAIAFA